MSKDLNDLAPTLHGICIEHLHISALEGIDMRILQTWRPLEKQARLYRSTRSIEEIRAKAKALAHLGCQHCADVLISVGPQLYPPWLQPGKHLTMAGPGESKHHKLDIFHGIWACAYDIGCFDKDGKYIQDGKHPDYVTAGRIGTGLGLQWLGEGTQKFKEAAHFQLKGLPGTKERIKLVVE